MDKREQARLQSMEGLLLPKHPYDTTSGVATRG
jgi:hypothetical protein